MSRTRTISTKILLDRLPPAAPEMEESLLGAMMVANRDEIHLLGAVREIIQSEADFAQPRHSALYGVLMGMYDAHQSIDMAQLVNALRQKNLIDAVGGEEHLVHLCDAMPIAANIAHYARAVAESARVRRIVVAAARTLEEAYSGQATSATLLAGAEHDLTEAAKGVNDDNASTLGDVVSRLVPDILAREPGKSPGIKTGFGEIDFTLGGLTNGEYIIVAARPSQGKSALALNMAMHIAQHTGPVVFFSLEMSRASLATRELSRAMALNNASLRCNDMTDQQRAQLRTMIERYKSVPLIIDDTAGLTPTILRHRATRYRRIDGIVAVFVDYAQIMGHEIEGNQNEQLTETSKAIKGLAKELNVPVVCLSQLNRGSTMAEDKHPSLSQLRSSGALEQDADVVMLLHRPDYYRPQNEWDNIAEVNIAKNRNGATRVVKLQWVPELTTFANLIEQVPSSLVQEDIPPY
jgi:replicative DNA helicase